MLKVLWLIFLSAIASGEFLRANKFVRDGIDMESQDETISRLEREKKEISIEVERLRDENLILRAKIEEKDENKVSGKKSLSAVEKREMNHGNQRFTSDGLINKIFDSSIRHTFIPFAWRTLNSPGEWPVFAANNNWNAYKRGFADGKNMWLGLEQLHQITKRGKWYLVLKMKWYKDYGQHNDDPKKGEWGVGVWPNFQVKGESDAYQWTFGKILVGHNFHFNPACDMLQHERNMKFSTADNDNDSESNENVADGYGCGWWFSDGCDTEVLRSWGVTEGGREDPECRDRLTSTPSEVMMAIFSE